MYYPEEHIPNSNLQTEEEKSFVCVGFTSQYYTLWFCGGGRKKPEYCQNLSKTETEAIKKAEAVAK